eukprot:3039490-Pyramimonas_sp.AAC.1
MPRAPLCQTPVCGPRGPGSAGGFACSGVRPWPPVVLASPWAIQLCPAPPGEKEIGCPAMGMGRVGVREGDKLGGRTSCLPLSNPGKRLKVAISVCIA